MNNKKIGQLLDKYWKAESSREEDKVLQEYYSDIPAEESPEAALFAYFEEQRSKTLSKTVKLKPRRRLVQMRYLLSIAASVMILTVAYFSFTSNPEPISEKHFVVDNPEDALRVTLDALSMVNGSMVKGEEKVIRGMQHLDKTFIFKS